MLLERVRPWFEALDAADGLRHPWRRHAHHVPDGRRHGAEREAAALEISQDRVLRLEKLDRLDWL